jgi:hypothetical protein
VSRAAIFIGALACALAIALAVVSWRQYVFGLGVAAGAARVQAAWDEAAAAAAAQRSQAEAQARADELIQARNAERIADEHARREVDLQARAARADARLRSLLDTIHGLAARPDDLPAAGAHAGAAAGAGDAAIARQLLGACAGRYAAVAADADRLRAQVTGLQRFVATACGGTHDD